MYYRTIGPAHALSVIVLVLCSARGIVEQAFAQLPAAAKPQVAAKPRTDQNSITAHQQLIEKSKQGKGYEIWAAAVKEKLTELVGKSR